MSLNGFTPYLEYLEKCNCQENKITRRTNIQNCTYILKLTSNQLDALLNFITNFYVKNRTSVADFWLRAYVSMQL